MNLNHRKLFPHPRSASKNHKTLEIDKMHQHYQLFKKLKLRTEPDEIDSSSHHIVQRKISREFIQVEGKRMPFKLHLQNQMRKCFYNDIISMKQQDKKIDEIKSQIQEQLKPVESRLTKTSNFSSLPFLLVYENEHNKKHKELVTRSCYSNSFYSILALNKISKTNVRKRL